VVNAALVCQSRSLQKKSGGQRERIRTCLLRGRDREVLRVITDFAGVEAAYRQWRQDVPVFRPSRRWNAVVDATTISALEAAMTRRHARRVR